MTTHWNLLLRPSALLRCEGGGGGGGLRCTVGLTTCARSFTTLTSGIAAEEALSGTGRIKGLVVKEGAGETERCEGGGGGGLRSAAVMSEVEEEAGRRNEGG